MRRSLRSWLWRVPIEQEVEEELAFHLEMRRREGRPVDPAEVERVRRACVGIARRRDREMRLTTWLEERQTDVRFALRNGARPICDCGGRDAGARWRQQRHLRAGG
jgi:hypothetical protein